VFPERVFAAIRHGPPGIHLFVEEIEGVARSAGAPRALEYRGSVDRNDRASKKLLNTISLIADGRILHTQPKTLLPPTMCLMKAWFEPAESRTVFPFGGSGWASRSVKISGGGSRRRASLPVDPVAELLDAGLR